MAKKKQTKQMKHMMPDGEMMMGKKHKGTMAPMMLEVTGAKKRRTKTKKARKK